MSSQTSLAAVEDFLAQHRLALVGLSRDPKHFSHTLLTELGKLGYELLPVNPTAAGEELAGHHVYASVSEIPEPVGGALIVTSAAHSEAAVRDALEAGVKRIWLYRAAGKGAVSDEALVQCHLAGASVVPGECPLMFVHNAHWLHRLHGWTKKVAGSYPQADAS